MKIRTLGIKNFTVFYEESRFELSDGVNTFIGENGTGKSHVLKLLYAVCEAARRHSLKPDPEFPGATSLNDFLSPLLEGIFRPDQLGRLVSRGVGRRKAEVRVEWDNDSSIRFSLSNLGNLKVWPNGDFSGLGRSIFVPPREVLSIFPGFAQAYLRREMEFDRTYYDLCVSLGLKPLRGARGELRKNLLDRIEEVLGGNVVVDSGRFYVRLNDGNMEAPLVAEGVRKLAMLHYLIVNGTLTENAFLFWDEPEANMNPKLASLTARIGVELAKSGVQVLLATHDYALASELELLSPETAQAFFALGRRDKKGVHVEAATTFTALKENAILDAFASIHDREVEAATSGAPEVEAATEGAPE